MSCAGHISAGARLAAAIRGSSLTLTTALDDSDPGICLDRPGVADDVCVCVVETIGQPPHRERILLGDSITSQARAVLVRWASTTWTFRLWLRDEIHLLPQPATPGERGHFPVEGAGVRCPWCGFCNWAHDSLFWREVRMNGRFPVRCLACAGLIPQWNVKGNVPDSQVLSVIEPADLRVRQIDDREPA